MLLPESKINNVHGISDEQRQRIMDFLRNAVYCWCDNNKDQWFAARDLLGGENKDWRDTPMFALYEKSRNERQAGRDAGNLLKRVLSNDSRRFETDRGRVRRYRWCCE